MCSSRTGFTGSGAKVPAASSGLQRAVLRAVSGSVAGKSHQPNRHRVAASTGRPGPRKRAVSRATSAA
ncbi:hypothetical protein ACFQY4_04260 [Catellatospora bangladeshensis]|uniref:hypothetical protein n=1 Tax=Catellatospora bangladeshensis TaxID=310355 RepID=UPI00361A9A85